MASAESACSPEAWAFGRLEELWERLDPLTPYGKDHKDQRVVMADRAAVERAYDDAEAFARFAAGADGVALDRLSHHLRRLPRLPFDEPTEGQLEPVELFLVKKFLANYAAARALLPDDLVARFGLGRVPAQLAAALAEGGTDPETFYVADAMHPALPAVRAEAAAKAAALRSERAAAAQRALGELGLDFGAREFLVVPNERARALLAHGSVGLALSVEAYDARSCVVRLQDGERALGLSADLEGLVARERELEAEVVARLSGLVRRDAGRLLVCAEGIRRLDVARARAVLAGDLGMTRPHLGSDPLVVRGARFLPCQWDCERLGLAYTPLDLRLETLAAVLFGSNMGGKTVALQSVVFLQAAAQAGLFVPAEAFATRVHPWICYIGETGAGRGAAARGGLSGFGFEIRSFVEAWGRAADAGALLVLDEFARTTSSAEAEAMLSAVIEALAALPDTRSLVATHFRGVARLEGVRYLRLLGLDRERAASALGAEEPLPERIRRINELMRYRIVEDTGDQAEGSDATTIALLLGLDPGIAARAAWYFLRRARTRRGRSRGAQPGGREPEGGR